MFEFSENMLDDIEPTEKYKAKNIPFNMILTVMRKKKLVMFSVDMFVVCIVQV